MYPLVTGRESLVQVTLLAGPPVEMQVRVKRAVPLRSELSVKFIISPIMDKSPAYYEKL